MEVVRVYVTGASGFIGGHAVRELRAAGHEVGDEWIDLLDRGRLRRAIEGCEAVFHLAALYSYDAPASEHERVNVEGTRTVVELCREEGVRRLVHTSTAGTCGPVPGRAATEGDEPPPWELRVPYKRTKLEAERLALAAGAVCVNPTAPVGEGDTGPTPTGAMVRGVATGRYRAALGPRHNRLSRIAALLHRHRRHARQKLAVLFQMCQVADDEDLRVPRHCQIRRDLHAALAVERCARAFRKHLAETGSSHACRP